MCGANHRCCFHYATLKGPLSWLGIWRAVALQCPLALFAHSPYALVAIFLPFVSLCFAFLMHPPHPRSPLPTHASKHQLCRATIPLGVSQQRLLPHLQSQPTHPVPILPLFHRATPTLLCSALVVHQWANSVCVLLSFVRRLISGFCCCCLLGRCLGANFHASHCCRRCCCCCRCPCCILFCSYPPVIAAVIQRRHFKFAFA